MPAKKPLHYLAVSLYPAQAVSTIKRADENALLVALNSGESIMIYLFERCPAVQYVHNILARNTMQQIHTLFALAGRWLTGDAATVHFDEASTIFSAVYLRRLYAYAVVDEHLMILPVYSGGLNADGPRFRYGPPVDLTDFKCRWVQGPEMQWAIAEFGAKQFWEPRRPPHAPGSSNSQQEPPGPHTTPPPRSKPRRGYIAQTYYDILGISRMATEDEIRQVYRQLAQQFHPDVNTSPEANCRMQMINEAYRQIMRK